MLITKKLILSSDKISLVIFTAKGCDVCHKLFTLMSLIERDYDDKVDFSCVTEGETYKESHQLVGFPTTIMFSADEKELDRVVGNHHGDVTLFRKFILKTLVSKSAEPSPLIRMRNFSAFLFTAFIGWLNSGAFVVPKAIHDARETQCKACEANFNVAHSTCNDCGCFLPAKWWAAAAFCPQKIWGQYTPPETLSRKWVNNFLVMIYKVKKWFSKPVKQEEVTGA